ncbi:elongation factor G-binding protein [Paenibacillus baekrokdamisoli]|uniref:Elongation factor G-binding protein n=1 Tax=Paenibacillus baekrokdamisoli TaxID=1712516 RepID=A0A3G9IMK4_9BACL|nr:FusB/FusC family EF-G-binding protein [Paenibacillus baekrokdamisoli]MBB3070721.1 hypothetical protein [Paenibacillus baekrokdamisoli]BBH20070.1 elongation factor G-binding protein [Paenibacillus baekrokdamisoli]
MVKPFIRNHQYNLIKKQAVMLQNACNTVSDRKVLESVKYSAQSKIVEAFPDVTELQLQMLEKISTINTAGEFQQYLLSLEPYLTEFVEVTEKQLKKLFPKIKKLKVPDLAAIDYRYVTYLGWTDIATNKLFLVYYLNGQLVGVEGRYTPVNKKSICFLCNRHEEVALFSAITKSKPANASPDYYKAIGNYLCVNSDTCNKNITDVTALEKFIHDVVGY